MESLSKFDFEDKANNRSKKARAAARFLGTESPVNVLGLMERNTFFWKALEDVGFSIRTGIGFEWDKDIAADLKKEVDKYPGDFIRDAIAGDISVELPKQIIETDILDIDLCDCLPESIAKTIPQTLKRTCRNKSVVFFTVQAGKPEEGLNGNRHRQHFFKKNLFNALQWMADELESTGEFNCYIDAHVDAYDGIKKKKKDGSWSKGKKMFVGALYVTRLKKRGRKPYVAKDNEILVDHQMDNRKYIKVTKSIKKYNAKVIAISNFCKKSGITRQQLAEESGAKYFDICNVISGKSNNRLDIVQKLKQWHSKQLSQ